MESSNLIAYVMDLISAGGDIVLLERDVLPDEIGRSPRDIRDALVLRVVRGGESLGFGSSNLRIEAGDKLVIVAQAGSP